MSSELTVVNQVIGGPFPDLLDELARTGTRLTILTGDDVDAGLLPEGAIIDCGPRYERHSLSARARSWSTFTLWAGARLAFVRIRGPVLLVSNPPTAVWLAWPLDSIQGRQVVTLVYDVYPDAFVEVELASRANPLIAAWKYLNRRAFASMASIVTLGESMARRLRNQSSHAKERLTILPNWADTHRLRPIPRAENAFARAHSLTETINVSYSGNIGATRGLGLMLSAAEQLKEQSDYRFVIIGDGSEGDKLRERIEERGLDNVTVLPFQSAEVFPESQASADIAVIPLDPTCDGIAVPSKLYSALSCGCAILGVSSGRNEIAETIEEFQCGINVLPEDESDFVEAIRGWHERRHELEACKRNARVAAEERFARDVVVAKWLELLEPYVSAGAHPNDFEDILKRLLDFTVAGAALGITWPVLAAAAFAVRATIGAPVLFRQERVGKANKTFELMKFRTMRHPRAGETGPEADSARLTTLGKFLRSTSIDELPTLLCVLKGDMSIVGPRPLLIRYLERYTERQARRHEVKPGITGLPQVRGRNLLSWEEKFELDVEYVETRSLWLDLRIMAETVWTVLARKGIGHEGHATMPEFSGVEEGVQGGA